jgi:hypothetical protein
MLLSAHIVKLGRCTRIVLSAAMADTARLAEEEATEICAAEPALRVLTGAPAGSCNICSAAAG